MPFNNSIILYPFLALIVFLIGSCNVSNSNQNPENVLTNEEKDALSLALEDEYKAEATYQNVIDDFGQIQPFPNILQAELRHQQALITLYNNYGLEVPHNTWYSKVAHFNSISEACSAGVQGEIENAELYDQILEMTDKEDLKTVFLSLQRASQEQHLPAFRSCR